MNFLFTQNKSKSFISIFLDHLIIGSCIFIYISYTVVKNSNYEEQKRLTHSHLDIGLLNNNVKEFLEPRTLIVKNIVEDEEILKSENIKKIFFIETHMDEVRIMDKPRIACSIESAGKNDSSKNYILKFTLLIT